MTSQKVFWGFFGVCVWGVCVCVLFVLFCFVLFFAFQHFEYHVSVEHDKKHPQPKFGGNLFSVNWPGS